MSAQPARHFPALLSLFFLVGSSLGAEVTAGFLAGVVLPGRQDISSVAYGAEGNVVARSLRSRVQGSEGAFLSATLTAWPEGLSFVGFRIEASGWRNEFALEEDSESSTRAELTETFGALYAGLVARFRLDQRGSFGYAGLTGGVAWEWLDNGQEDRARTFGILGGASFLLRPDLRMRIEMKYLICSDLSFSGSTGAGFETSGSKNPMSGRSLFGPHLDKVFVPLTLGLEWIF